ncbi:MAG: AEC family transporter [Bauldia sp.]|uniref:AEC family transporter n=1 Tax=Bauldia sp. TaxID=2575872 RepID=UPI001DAE4D30|nr:AEC family transporter [Bauldia sp.]MCB1496788.1 AEC family transporter [Bauldia sp.]
MSQFLSIILPFLGLIAAGFSAARWLGLPAQGVSGLNLFVYYFALPAWFFQLVAETSFRDLPSWSFLLTTTFATYCAFAIAFSFGALVNRGNVPEATIQGLVGSYANIGYMAPALTVAAFGPLAAAPTALIFTFDSMMLFALVPLMMTLGGTSRTDGRSMARSIGRRVATHPVIIATVLGVLFSVAGLPLPGPVTSLLDVLRSAAVPVALFSIGAGLVQMSRGRLAPETPVILLVKLVVHPLIVYLLLSWIGGFDIIWVYAAVLMAALPPAANVLALARQYATYERRAAAAVYYGTVASIVTLSVTLVLLLSDDLPVDPFR